MVRKFGPELSADQIKENDTVNYSSEIKTYPFSRRSSYYLY